LEGSKVTTGRDRAPQTGGHRGHERVMLAGPGAVREHQQRARAAGA
jgi:hypothetical protein